MKPDLHWTRKAWRSGTENPRLIGGLMLLNLLMHALSWDFVRYLRGFREFLIDDDIGRPWRDILACWIRCEPHLIWAFAEWPHGNDPLHNEVSLSTGAVLMCVAWSLCRKSWREFWRRECPVGLAWPGWLLALSVLNLAGGSTSAFDLLCNLPENVLSHGALVAVCGLLPLACAGLAFPPLLQILRKRLDPHARPIGEASWNTLALLFLTFGAPLLLMSTLAEHCRNGSELQVAVDFAANHVIWWPVGFLLGPLVWLLAEEGQGLPGAWRVLRSARRNATRLYAWCLLSSALSLALVFASERPRIRGFQDSLGGFVIGLALITLAWPFFLGLRHLTLELLNEAHARNVCPQS